MPVCNGCGKDRAAALYPVPVPPPLACGHVLCILCRDQTRSAWTEWCHNCGGQVCSPCLEGGWCQTCRNTCPVQGCTRIASVQCVGCDAFFCGECAKKFRKCKSCGKTRCQVNCVPTQKNPCGTCISAAVHSALTKANLKPKQNPDHIVYCTQNPVTSAPAPNTFISYGADLALCPRCNQSPDTHPTPKLIDAPATREKVKAFSALLTANIPAPLAPGHRTPRMIGVLAATTPNGRTVYLAAISGWNPPAGWDGWVFGAGMIPCATLPSQTMAKNSLDVGGGSVPQLVAAAGSNAPGQCAAPKLIQTALRAGYTPMEMTEIWWNPDDYHPPAYLHNTVYSSCATCQNNVAQMLCH
jgi:hypothetical protein